MTDAQSASTFTYNGSNKLRLAYIVSHPIQYHAPLLRKIAEEPDIDLKVFFSSDLSVREKGFIDKGFGVKVKWDIPLLEGYKYEFLPVLCGADKVSVTMPFNYGIEKKIREGKFDVILSIGYGRLTNMRAIRAAKSLKIPVLLRTDSTLYNQPPLGLKRALKSLFFAWLKPNISAVLSAGVSNSAYYRHYFGEQFPIFLCRFAVDNLFFQRECDTASKSREEFRKSLGLDAGRPVILFAAKLMPRKRCGDLLDAFLQLNKSSDLHPAPYLLIVGDGEERVALEEKAKEAGPGNVCFLGFRNQSELPRFYDLCNVFVLASVNEPWGLAINEVMNAGRAVIVSDEVGCQKDLVQHGVNGCVIRARDVQALAESLRVVLADERTNQAMGAESRRMIQEFSFAQNVHGLRLALQALVPGFPALPEL